MAALGFLVSCPGENSRITCAAAVISPMVSFFTRRPVISEAIINRHLAAHDEPHDVQHLVMKNLAVFDGALQRFLGGDFVAVGHPKRKIVRVSPALGVDLGQ